MAEEEKVLSQVNDVFARALEAKKKQEAEVEAKKNYVPVDREETEYCILQTNKEIVFRPVGDPFDPNSLVSNKDTDIKIFMFSQVVKDDNLGYINVNWPAQLKVKRTGASIIPDPDFILTKLYNKVYEREWIKYPEGKTEIRNGKKCDGEWKYLHKDTDIFKRLELNGKNGQMNKFAPKAYVYMNVIDRMDDWCEKNKHTKLLISGMGYGKEQTDTAGNKITPKYPKKGISKFLYDKIFDQLVKTTGGWNKDAVVKKTGEKLDTEYSIFEASDLRVQTKDISEEAFKLSKEIGMPSDWTMYDLATLTKPSSAFKLKKHLSGLFKLFDGTFPGFNLSNELEEIAKIEQEEYNKKNKTEAETSLEKQKEQQVAALKEETKAETKVEAPKAERSRASTSASNESVEDLCKKNFSFYESLCDSDKKLLVDSIAKFDGTIPLWKPNTDLAVCPNEKCFYKGTTINTNFPFAMKCCPECGQE